MINRATYATDDEMRFGYYDIDIARFHKVPSTLASRKLLTGATPTEDAGCLIATKVEYYIFHKIAADLFVTNDARLTARQIRVFNAIKQVNEKLLFEGNLFLERDASEKQLIKTLDAQPLLHGWASIHDILEVLTRDGGVPLSKSTVDREINILLSERLITQRKDPTVPNKLRFRVDTFSLGCGTELPNPGEILDPVYEGEPVTVVNLLTGKPETI